MLNPSDQSTSGNFPSNVNSAKPSPIFEKFAFICNQLTDFCSDFENADITDQTDSLLEVKLDDLIDRWRKVQQEYENLMLSPESVVSKELKQNAKVNLNICSEAYYDTRSQILDVLRMSINTAPRRNSRLTLLPERNSEPRNSNSNSSEVCIKVPPCDTEVFKGSYEEWPSFRDMFTAVYVNHPKLTPAQKLYHLRNKTKSSAGAIVKRYALCDENFTLAWNALKSRYENKRVLVDNQLKILFNIPVATSEDSESLQRIHSTVKDCLSTLTSLNVNIDSWDPMLIYLVSTKLPEETISQWEQSLKSHRELPSWSQMDEFLINRFEVVERISSFRNFKVQNDMTQKNLPQGTNKIQTYTSQEKLNVTCSLCNLEHSIRICPDFRKFSPQERIDFAFKKKICINCLSSSHLKTKCKSKRLCFTCHKPHHSLLHLERNPISNDQSQNSSTSASRTTERNFSTNNAQHPTPSTSKEAYNRVDANFSQNSETILLRTALVQIEHEGELFTIRALIDPGSQRTFLSEKVRNLLNIPFRKSRYEIGGIGGITQFSDKECDLVIYSPKHNTRFSISAIILPKVTRKLPAVSFEIPKCPDFLKLDLADPNFNISSHIDLILGNDSERFINIDGIKKDVYGSASAYNTIFGWVLSGPMPTESILSFTTKVFALESDTLSDALKRFWEIEEVPAAPEISESEKFCEDFYATTTTRDDDGRYVVRLPFRKEFPESISLGSSRFTALGQYTRMERTLLKDPDMQDQYNSVLQEYITLNHMEETSSQEICAQGKFYSFYLPHHAVFRPEHKSTKVRIVFNASRKSKSGFSLNDVLYTGPTLQNDLIFTILNWRKYKYVCSGDIQKMYRQIKIHPDDRAYQRILFQSDPKGPVQDYQLNRVTFGINCAPFLAIRTMLQLASDSETQFPEVAKILRRETYVDDILFGGFSIEETIASRKSLVSVLNSAGFPLKKITANDPELLKDLLPEDLYDLNLLRFAESSSTKTLGIKWNALSDKFSYSTISAQSHTSTTKRQVLSQVAQLFDPVGWVTPVIIRAKMLMQQLWMEKSGWDDEISPDSHRNWNYLLEDLSQINVIEIPRWIQYMPTDKIQIHGFCDASKGAYCACVYLRLQTSTSTVFSNLFMAKSKVAPLKPVSLPKLELNGALLLSHLVKYVSQIFDDQVASVTLWSDASIVLGWLSKPPYSWETYVANRTSQIHELVPNAKWRYVATHHNPADIGTRGCSPRDLAANCLWWNGPSWLTNPESTWPTKNPIIPNLPTQKITSHQVTIDEDEIISRFSSYSRALRVLAYVFRFFHNIHPRSNNNRTPQTVEISQNEIQFTKNRIISLTQQRYYNTEYQALRDSKPLPHKSALLTLNPFLDSDQVLRANGRLSNSSLPYKERFPIILPGNSHFCTLYLSHLHTFLAHGECNQMCRFVQTEYYITRLKPRVKGVIHRCKTCIIYKHKPSSQIMAPLPSERSTFSPPFHITGIDFAGPFELKSSSLRKAPIIKGYVCVFVCFSTKAIHLEACTELSSAAFEAALARFVGRRGLPSRIYSDNGRNFVGASRALLREFSMFIKTTSSSISQKYSVHGFEWIFIPPHAPHMGGLWEAAVKSFKTHFKKLAGAHRFTFEQFSTLLSRIEGVLNSRPISAMSEDPSDFKALTPGHFLRGSPILALPEPISPQLSLINRWTKLKALHHQFALRWKEEYLKTMHKRYKWKSAAPNLKVNDLVVVIDDLLPPYEWLLGRIVKTYCGSDTKVRVADVRTETGTVTRPIAKLCYLPFSNSCDEAEHNKIV
ncbi:uncharacterized protein LOC142231444 [Haematobia irritans]|uniref:uncharacterized protein LOC142231444 n=1 Tax=Haematobia irritans TaxID=7368 RepID=UPI003F509531